MSNPNGLPMLDFGGTATYRIIVQGELDARWSERLAGMSISCEMEQKGKTIAQLEGLLHDQAEAQKKPDRHSSLQKI